MTKYIFYKYNSTIRLDRYIITTKKLLFKKINLITHMLFSIEIPIYNVPSPERNSSIKKTWFRQIKIMDFETNFYRGSKLDKSHQYLKKRSNIKLKPADKGTSFFFNYYGDNMKNNFNYIQIFYSNIKSYFNHYYSDYYFYKIIYLVETLPQVIFLLFPRLIIKVFILNIYKYIYPILISNKSLLNCNLIAVISVIKKLLLIRLYNFFIINYNNKFQTDNLVFNENSNFNDNNYIYFNLIYLILINTSFIHLNVYGIKKVLLYIWITLVSLIEYVHKKNRDQLKEKNISDKKSDDDNNYNDKDNNSIINNDIIDDSIIIDEDSIIIDDESTLIDSNINTNDYDK